MRCFEHMTSQRTSSLADGAAISVSLLCLLHCLAVPVALTVAPWIVPGFLADERFHDVAVLVALPISAFALANVLATRPGLVLLAGIGLCALTAGAFVESEVTERALTTVGAIAIALAHLRNFMSRVSSA